MSDPSPESEKLFGDLLVEQGLATPEQVRECLALQEERRSRGDSSLPNLAELLLQKGYLSPESYSRLVSLRSGHDRELLGDTLQNNLLAIFGGEWDRVEPWEEAPSPPEVLEAMEREENRFGKYVRVSKIGAGRIGIINALFLRGSCS